MRNDHIPDILVTEIDANVDPTIDTIQIIRSKPLFRKTILLGYTNNPNKNDSKQIFNDGFLDIVDSTKITTTVFQVVHLFTQKHGKTSLTSFEGIAACVILRGCFCPSSAATGGLFFTVAIAIAILSGPCW